VATPPLELLSQAPENPEPSLDPMMAVPGALVKGSYASKAAWTDGFPVTTAAAVNIATSWNFNEDIMVWLVILG
jgi:hypothetical protein